MALPKRASPTQLQNASTQTLKQRVITCLNKLSDRDTHAIATTELESIARNLSHDSFSPFLTCIYDTDSSEKAPVRKQCVRLLGFLSETHGEALSPFISKMMANIVRRLRDPDTAVRSACVDSVTTMASQINKPPFSTFLKPLMETILQEQDYNSQIGSALCLASAIEASIDPEPAQLRRLLPRLVKLLKSESFKAKPALLSLIGSIVGVGGSVSHNVLENLIPYMIEFLSSEDWSTRKAAAEAFAKLALKEKEMLSEFRSSCLAAFETRRFDKVKVVRDRMNEMVEVWKDVPDCSSNVSPSSQSKSPSSTDSSSSRNSSTTTIESPKTRRISVPTSRSPALDSSSATTITRRSPLKSCDAKSSPALFGKLDCKKQSDFPIGIAVPQSPSFIKEDLNGRDQEPMEQESNVCPKLETKRVLFSKNSDDKMQKFGALKAGSRVYPVQEDSSESNVVLSNATVDFYGNDEDTEDLSLIRKQLAQIENQQSSLFDLLQKFIGSSRHGIRSLETRVLGIEMALDGISYDLAMSSGRMSNANSAESTCCMLPGTEFLSSKFKRKTEDRYSTSKFSSPVGTPSSAAMCNMDDKDGCGESFKLQNRRLWLQGGSGFAVNPLALAEMHSQSRTSSDLNLNRIPKNISQDMPNDVVGSRVWGLTEVLECQIQHSSNNHVLRISSCINLVKVRMEFVCIQSLAWKDAREPQLLYYFEDHRVGKASIYVPDQGRQGGEELNVEIGIGSKLPYSTH
ncbi:HEAT [Macleaya cordata]|uniref:HEAT n=1 Tax=Macleaya cordata TaxID=56857 RepID=A0A200QFA7_MACCD|nr:HEAT [Macleaya cordata]